MHKLLVLAVLALGSRAYADRKAADQLAAEARRDPTKLDACGAAYLEVYNRDPTARDNDEVLAAAASCFHDAHSVSAELQTYAVLAKYYPSSKLGSRATRASAHAYAQIAQYDRAAELLETYAMKYANERDAGDALLQAIAYRAALGDTASQIEYTHRFTKAFAFKQRAAAAAAEFALGSVYDGDDAIKHLRMFVARYAQAEPELAGLAYARLGDLLWTRSCPVRATDGLCLAITRQRADHCGAPELMKVVAVARTADARVALEQYRNAGVALAKAPPSARGRHAAAMAQLALADAELETLLRASFPKDLDLDPAPAHHASREHSFATFVRWVADETKLTTTASQAYERVLDLKDLDASVAAASRIGEAAQAFWRALLVGEIPRAILHGDFAKDKRAAYCSELRRVAEPIAERAVEAFRTCLTKSSELGGGLAWANLCEREGHALAPEQFPIGHELVGPLQSFTPIAVEPALP